MLLMDYREEDELYHGPLEINKRLYSKILHSILLLFCGCSKSPSACQKYLIIKCQYFENAKQRLTTNKKKQTAGGIDK